MTTILDQLSPETIGERLRAARDEAGETQAAAATAAGIARTTLVSIEQGQRKVRLDELLKLVRHYGTTVNALLRTEAAHGDLLPKFRQQMSISAKTPIDTAAELLSHLAKAETELEALLGVHRIRNFPQQRPILPGDVRAQAEQDAGEVRAWLGLGSGPIIDLVPILDFQMGVRVFLRPLDRSISGLYAYDEAIGACVLINANHPRSRRNHTAAHELGHLVTSRGNADVLQDGSPEQARDERYANAFAAAFLIPSRPIMQRFHEITAGSKHFARRHVIVLAHAFAVSREAMVRRLEDLKLVKPGTWDWFLQHGNITDAQAKQVLGEASFADVYESRPMPPTSLRLNQLAADVWHRDLLSEGQLARLLRIDRVALREILDGLDDEVAETDPVLALHG